MDGPVPFDAEGEAQGVTVGMPAAADRDLRRDDRDALALANEQLIGAQREGSEDAVDSAEILNLIEGEGFRPWSFQQRAAAAPLTLT